MGQDACYVRWNGGGGFGDPLEREPADVRMTYCRPRVRRAAAAVFGVVVKGDAVDAAAPTPRKAVREERLAGRARREALALGVARRRGRWHCRASATTGWRRPGPAGKHAALLTMPVKSLPGAGSAIEDRVVLRHFCCPYCATSSTPRRRCRAIRSWTISLPTEASRQMHNVTVRQEIVDRVLAAARPLSLVRPARSGARPRSLVIDMQNDVLRARAARPRCRPRATSSRRSTGSRPELRSARRAGDLGAACQQRVGGSSDWELFFNHFVADEVREKTLESLAPERQRVWPELAVGPPTTPCSRTATAR